MIKINAGDRVVRKKDGLEYLVIYIGYNNKEWYLILEDYNDRSKKSTCEYSFDLEKDYELIRANKIEPLEYFRTEKQNCLKPIIQAKSKTDNSRRYEQVIQDIVIPIGTKEVIDKINEIIEYINNEEK